MPNTVRLGTSGYSFQDWKGVFYPEDIKKGKMLDFYSVHFNTVEVNSTYYKIPHSSVFYWLSQKTGEDFEFIVKVHQAVTHERSGSFESMKQLKESIRPIVETNKFKGYLAQFPWSFKFSPQNLEYIQKMVETAEGHHTWVEFRHKSWIKEQTFQTLHDNNIGYCCVDEPELNGLIPPQSLTTTDISYVRFHGRNTVTWWDSSKGDRYDYLYNRDELAGWIEKIRELRKNTSKTYLFFNNCHHGHAVKNAKMMAELLKNQLNVEL